MSTLKIENLHVSIDDKEILKGVNLEVNTNESHAIMGPNGNGKSTLLLSIMGHPRYQITKGKIELDGVDITDYSVDDRARAGLFLGMQYPVEVEGVTNSDFLRAALNSQNDKPISLFKFIKELDKEVADLKMKPDLAHRYLNAGFSGGEKKRNEILHMKMLKPKFALLDEIDSGLDVDAIKIVGNALKEYYENNDVSFLIITHHTNILKYLVPTHVHILDEGKIIKSGDNTLASLIEKEGYKS